MERVTGWRDEAISLLKNRPARIKLKNLASEIGVSYSWLRAFESGKIPEPSVVSVQTLIVFLRRENDNKLNA